MNDEFRSSRSNQRAKRRKTNLILNSLIAIVVLLILIISYNIFAGDNKENNEAPKIENKANPKDKADKEVTSDVHSSNVNEETDLNNETDTSTIEEPSSELNNPEDDELVETEGGSDPSVNKTMINPTWKPVGTTQTGEHQTVYDQTSVDWQEMSKAVSYATGIEESNMVIWFRGRDGQSANKSVSTVSAKGSSIKYKVYTEWVDGEGWKPTKVEELK